VRGPWGTIACLKLVLMSFSIPFLVLASAIFSSSFSWFFLTSAEFGALHKGFCSLYRKNKRQVPTLYKLASISGPIC